MNEIVKINATHKNVFVALASAQMEMDSVKKGAINPAFKGEGKPKGTAYADLADVLLAVMPALNRNGLALFHQMVMEGGERVMRTVLAHGESDTHINCDVPLIVTKNDMQGMKSATTYAKRIGTESVTGVAPEDDDGNAAAKAAPAMIERPEPSRINQDISEMTAAITSACLALEMAGDLDALATVWKGLRRDVQADGKVIAAKDARKAELGKPRFEPAGPTLDDSIPY